VLEPLASYDDTGSIVPVLAEEVPTVENGGISPDRREIVWKLKPGIVWSDGTPLTAEDVAFSAAYCMDPAGGCHQAGYFAGVESVEALDPLTVRIRYAEPQAHPYVLFIGAKMPVIQRAQFENCKGARAPTCTRENFHPVGTGPFKVVEFRANDVISYAANERFREPGKPAFATVTLKGGGDAASAARAVLETGEFDFTWNVQVEPEVLAHLAAGGKGRVVTSFGTSVERLEVNLSNPHPELGELRSTLEGGAHPFMNESAVRKALSLAIDRSLVFEAGYAAGKVTCNILPAPEIYVSDANDSCLTQDLETANRLLDEAGWRKGPDGVREKDGVRLSILFQTSTNSVRQSTQALLKQMWQAIGVETELRNIDPAVFFGSDPSSPDTFQKFYADIQLYAYNFDGTDPEKYMSGWTCKEIPSPENQWLGNNLSRYCDERYDAIVAQMGRTFDLDERARLARQLKDLLVVEGIVIPLVHRADVAAVAADLEGVRMNSWDSELWNIKDWRRAR
jgi:peptide/nickel transport system substrate-binding protein